MRAQRAAETNAKSGSVIDASPAPTTEAIAGPQPPNAVKENDLEFEWPDFLKIGEVGILKETETQTNYISTTEAGTGPDADTTEHKSTSTKLAKTHKVPGLPPNLRMDDVVMYLYDNPVVSASQATTELLPPESDIDGRGEQSFRDC